ncbi:hypothetical protein BD779DRAFT_1542070 [Infundibulicybe gibba]|nr:hypothetical protein BD779DRAFT_1542070 [Infundibulicybe gibba]
MGQSSSGPISQFPCKGAPGKVHCARLPADGSVPHIVTLRTVDIRDDNNVDAKLYHIPDCRPYWPTDVLWQKRAYGTMLVKPQPDQPPQLEGTYYMFKTRAVHGIPANKHLRRHIFGDIFIAKPNDEGDEDEGLDEEPQVEGEHEGENKGGDGEHQGEDAEGGEEGKHGPTEPEAVVEPEKPAEPEEVQWRREWPVYEDNMISTMIKERFWYE